MIALGALQQLGTLWIVPAVLDADAVYEAPALSSECELHLVLVGALRNPVLECPDACAATLVHNGLRHRERRAVDSSQGSQP